MRIPLKFLTRGAKLASAVMLTMPARAGLGKPLAGAIAAILFLGNSLLIMANNTSNQRLAPCPESSNCVSSQATDATHRIDPIRYETDFSTARARLLAVILAQPRVTLVRAEPRYLHIEFRSTVFQFVDDVEFLFPETEPIIHVRSASRSGRYDFGVNRRRVERLRQKFSQSLDKL